MKRPPLIHISFQDDPPADLEVDALEPALTQFLIYLSRTHEYAGGVADAGDARDVNLLLADDATLAELNGRFRDNPKPTDILSWSYEGEIFGEMALSLERARTQAKENGWNLTTEVLRLLAHGMAHLAGYDHQTPAEDKVMRELEESLLAEIGLTGLY